MVPAWNLVELVSVAGMCRNGAYVGMRIVSIQEFKGFEEFKGFKEFAHAGSRFFDVGDASGVSRTE
jgi:hypothetical protein